MEGILSPGMGEQPEDWAVRQFGQARLGDVRRTERAVKVAAAMAVHPAGSIPDQMRDWASTKAAYRLFDQEQVTFEALMEPHWKLTRESAGRRRRVLMIHDGTQLDYSSHKRIEGLSSIGDGGGRGMMLHSVLAVDPSAGATGTVEVLGLAHQRIWYRRSVPEEETRTQRKARQQQGRIWVEAVEAVGSPPDTGVRWMEVADREADNFDFFQACDRRGNGFVVRAYQDRRASLGHDARKPGGYLLELARSLKPMGSKKLYVRRRPKREPRWAELKVAAGAVTIFPPWLSGQGAMPLRCWVVRVWEDDPPPGEERIEWVLLCSDPVEHLEDALQVAEWYGDRWLIEEYHKCLKTGCRVESRQLEEVERLEPLVGMLAVVAVRLLQLKQQARMQPDRPAQECVSADHVRVLGAYFGRPSETMTVYEFWRSVGRMGGFLARKGDGEPGWQTLWRGWQKLDLMTIGARLGTSGEKRCG